MSDRPLLAKLQGQRFYFAAELGTFSPKSYSWVINNIKKIDDIKPKNWVNSFLKNKKSKNTLSDHVWISLSWSSKKTIPCCTHDEYDYINDAGDWIVLAEGTCFSYEKGYYQNIKSHKIDNAKVVALYQKSTKKLFNNL
jgi:hypothetical protein